MNAVAVVSGLVAAAVQPPVNSKPLGFAVLVPVFAALACVLLAWAWWVRSINMALGLGVSVAMWALTYVALLQPGFVLSELLFGAAILAIAVGGYVAARSGAVGASGLVVGAVSGVVNTMMAGATLPRGEGQQRHAAEFAMIAAGLLAGSALLGWIGQAVGRARASAQAPAAVVPFTINPAVLMAIVNAAAIFCMIVLGGLVTSLEAGLAVPDWPNTMGHNMLLYPLSQMQGGVFYEHSHRLFGMLVGVTTLCTAAVVWKHGRAGRALAAAMVALVIGQGVLGGMRVTGALTTSLDAADLAPSTSMGMIHGMLGQAVFALAAVLPLVLTERWQRAPHERVSAPKGVRLLPALALGALSIQLFLGVAVRHLQAPPTETAGAKIPSWALHSHITMAVVAAVLVAMAGIQCSSVASLPWLRRNGKAAMHTVFLQILLGGGALVAVLLRRGTAVPWWEATAATAHQAVGALLLAVTAMLWAQSRRWVLPQGSQPQEPPARP